MKKNYKVMAFIMSLFIMCVGVLTAYASVTIDGYTYNLTSSDTASLIGWDNSSDCLYVPDAIGRYYVSEIANSAFSQDNYIKHLDLSDARHLKRIGMFAFSNSVLEGSIIIPPVVNEVGVSAFEGCTGLEEVVFSSDGGKVSTQCFQNCTSLKSITLTEYITSIERKAFYNCTALDSILIPKTVSSINTTAFLGCENVIINCYYGSYAVQFAEENSIPYNIIDPPTEEPTTAPTEAPTTAPSEAPTLAPTEVPTEAIVPILGDADGNGVIEVDDATYVQRVIAELPVPYPMETIMQGDVDGDGELTITDATLIQRYVAEMPVNYPIGEPIAK